MKRSRQIKNLAAMLVSDEQETNDSDCSPNFEQTRRKKSRSEWIEESNRESIRSNEISDAWSNFFSSDDQSIVDTETPDISCHTQHSDVSPHGQFGMTPQHFPEDLNERLSCFDMAEKNDLSCWEFDVRCIETSPVFNTVAIPLHNNKQPCSEFSKCPNLLTSITTLQKSPSATFMKESVDASPQLEFDHSRSLIPVIHLSE